MKRVSSTSGMAAGIAGVAVLAQLAAVRAFSSATTHSVSFFGRQLHWECWFKQHFGMPCPNCGLTRSVVLALHGNMDHSWMVNPAGTLIVGGLLLFCGAMFFLLLRARATPLAAGAAETIAPRKIAVWTSAYGALIFAVLIAHWLREIF